MSYSGDAAEQVVRMSLEGGQAAVKLAGEGAKQIAVLLSAVLREQKKTKGKARLTNMLRSGKELKVFAVRDSDLRRFCQEAQKYGVLYCVLKDRDANDGITDIMVRAEDASKINRIFERFDLATVDLASVKSEIQRDQTDPVQEGLSGQDAPKQEQDAFLEALLSQEPERENEPNPPSGQTEKSSPSGPTSTTKEPSVRGISDEDRHFRPSVRQKLKEIKADLRERTGKEPAPVKPLGHQVPAKKKLKKQKER